jgi:telomerase reverse transcriptase
MRVPDHHLSSTCTSSAFKTQKSLSTDPSSTLEPASISILPRKPSMMEYATPTAMVAAFCRAVLFRLIPHDFWGAGEIRVHNQTVVQRNLDRFIGLRRFETLSLHEIFQGIKVCAMSVFDI